MQDFSKEIEFIKKHSLIKPSILEIQVKKEWRSSTSEFRSLIRQGFLQSHPAEVDNRLDFLKLDQIPQLKKNFISISHSETEGGYAFSNLPFGFDLIERDRLNEKILARVSTPKELIHAIDPYLLWPAKEAVFKACSEYLTTITEVHIEHWDALAENFFAFEVLIKDSKQKEMKSRGFVFEKFDILYGIYFRP